MTTEKSTGREQIIKYKYKYEKVQQTIYEKRKELKEKQYEALQKGKRKKEMVEIESP